MIQYCIDKIKSHPRFFIWLKNNHFLMGIISWLLLLRFVMTRGGVTLTFLFMYHSFCYYILQIDRDVTLQIQGVAITMPNHMKAIDGAIEVLYDEFYDKLQGYNCVLDLGGYIGESAIRLSQTNKQVMVYEAHPINYQYLLKNIKPYHNIIPHNDAVVGNNQKIMTFYGGAFDMGAGSQKTSHRENNITVPCVNMIDILQTHNVDAMKMDIEGAEYECMTTLIEDVRGKELFTRLKAGFIEFHFYQQIEKIQQTLEIIEWVSGLGYHIDCFDAVSSKKITIHEIGNYEIVFIYFSLDNE